MKKIMNNVFKYAFLFGAALFIVSCSDDAEDNGMIETELSQAEVNTLLETEDIASSVDTALAELFNDNGSTAKTAKNDCYSAEYTDTGFTATFNNCVLNGTDNINGTLVVTYGANENTAEFTATYTDFFVGDIKINGTRTFVITSSNEESVAFTVNSTISVEFADGSTISENGTKTFAIVFEEGQDTLWNLSGSWTIQKDGNTYSVSGDISKQFTCAYWSSGSMTVNKNGLEVDVDFGDGTCDDKATLTYPNGASEEIDL
ncbi:hypothetical protein [Allomuricauda sp. d1]|uniref:hypothetical protein n=1 Tax=Allomuricauda sp. d1 TaxID=3136725 RepID=UPI0031E3913A